MLLIISATTSDNKNNRSFRW